MQVYNDNDTLKCTVLGTWFYPEYFDSIKNDNIKDPLKRVAEEIHQDLYSFETKLREHGVQVIRPAAPSNVYDPDNPITPALQVRDSMKVIGSNLYKFIHTDYNLELQKVLPNFTDLVDILSYKQNLPSSLYSKQQYNILAGSSWPSFEDFCKNNYVVHKDIQKEIELYKESFTYDKLASPEGPNIILTDKEIIVDHHEYIDYIKRLKPYINIDKTWRHINTHAGHTDGCFSILNSNTILGIGDIIDKCMPEYKNKIRISWNNYQKHISEFKKHKKQVGGRWWIPGQEQNSSLTNFVEQYLTHLVGYVEETQFDVNLLSLDEKTVFVNTNDPSYLTNNGFSIIPIQWRHRWFVDGGLHCITLDLHRE